MQSLDDFTVITECVPLEQVWFASSLTAEPELISTEELGRRLNFTYMDSILAPNRVSELAFDPEEDTEVIARKNLRLKQYVASEKHNQFVVRFISPEVGYGVFAKDLIPAGSNIGLYAGIINLVDGPGGNYTTGLSRDYRIDAENFGGITRLIQHMPFSLEYIEDELDKNKKDFMKLVGIFEGLGYSSDPTYVQGVMGLSGRDKKANVDKFLKDNLDQVRRDPDLSDSEAGEELANKPFLREVQNLAFANIIQQRFIFKGDVWCFMKAMVDILPGQQLGVCYGLDYWVSKRIVPRYFNKKGELIPKEAYLGSLNALVEKYKKPTETFLPAIEVAFRRAAAAGCLKDVRRFLEYGVDIDAQDDNPASRNTALHWAISRQHDEVTKLLLAWKARTNIENAQNETAEELLGERLQREDPSPRA